MYDFKTRFADSSIPFLFLMALLMVFTGCDGSNPMSSDDASSRNTTSGDVLSRADINYVRAVPMAAKSGKPKYLLRIALKEKSRWRSRLDGLRILSRTATDEPVIIRDDGLLSDKRAHDGIFTGIIPDGCLSRPLNTKSDGDKGNMIAAGKDPEFGCTVTFSGPGQECGDFGKCPERVHRSILWGLIEYDTNIVVCICLSECTFSIT